MGIGCTIRFDEIETEFDMERNNVKVKIDNKPNQPMPKDYGELKIVNHPKYIIVNGALYEKIDDSVLIIADRYGDMDT